MAAASPGVGGWLQSVVDDCHQSAAETLFQLSLSAAGKQAMLAHDGCMVIIRHHAGAAQSPVSAQCGGALRSLEGVPRRDAAAGAGMRADRKHLMVSYQWDHQNAVVRIVASLKMRSFTVWFDLEAMSGSTLDAMAAAVEGASCVLLCMSEKYKASANCRLEGTCE